MIQRILAVLLGLLFPVVVACAGVDGVGEYNVVWDTPSQNSHGSMPLGNGDVGVNAWVEPGGDIVFYISKTDAWDESARLCKIGRVRVKFYPALDVSAGFRQELKLEEGLIHIQARSGGQPVDISLWVDAEQPVIRFESESDVELKCRAEVELWRLRERPFAGDEDSHSGNGLAGSSYKPTVLPDVVVSNEQDRVIWYHRNTRSIYNLSLEVQHLEALKGKFPDLLLNRTFGACISGAGFVRDGDRAVSSEKALKRHELSVCVLTDIAETPEAWLKDLEGIRSKVSSAAKSKKVTAGWWKFYWARSWISLGTSAGADEKEKLKKLNSGYVMQRFMNACSGRGGSPIKFNGSIFTVEQQPGANPESSAGCPDWRRWGGNYWFQNTRHCYWSMYAAGDFDLMKPFFNLYREAIPLSKARIKTYYGFDNAAQFPETMYLWGLPNNGDYGWGNKAPEPSNGYIKRYWSGGIELTTMMLDYYDYTQDGDFARDTLVPVAAPIISFLDQYWQKLDANGKRIFDPAQSLETYHSAVNPLPEIAGLNFVLPRLLALPDRLVSDEQRVRWTKLLNELPPMPMGERDGQKVLKPADSFGGTSNSENPELYSVFPYRVYGIGRESLDMAKKTYEVRRNRMNFCWCQDSIQAACLGLGEEAGRLVVARASSKPCQRFPAMWGPHNDWTPDTDHGNPILTTLHFMLMQYDGDKIWLFPAWPKGWDVSFKLHAPKRTVVEGEYRDGRLVSLKVTPKERSADILNMLGQQ